jgi:hypothetical protein
MYMNFTSGIKRPGREPNPSLVTIAEQYGVQEL